MATERIYLQNLAAPYSPATLKGNWESNATLVDKRLARWKDGSMNGGDHSGFSGPNADRSFLRCVSRPLIVPRTFGGTAGFGIAAEGSHAISHLHVYLTQGDSDSVRGTLITDVDVHNTWTGGASGRVATGIAVSTVAGQVGDRIVLEFGPHGDSSGGGGYIYWGGTGLGPDILEGNGGFVSNTCAWLDLDLPSTTAPFISGRIANAHTQNGAQTFLHASTGDPLYVFVNVIAARTVSSVTFNGTGLTQLHTGTSGSFKQEVWILVSPGTVTANVVITTATDAAISGGAINIANGPSPGSGETFTHASGTSTSPGVTLSSVATDLVIDVVTSDSGVSFEPTSPQIAAWRQDSWGNVASGCSERPGAASVTTAWTYGSSTPWSILAMSIAGVPTSTFNALAIAP
jgi:hypothetical protein